MAPSKKERFAGLESKEVERIEHVQGLLSFLLCKREEDGAGGVLLEVIQLLAGLTGLPDGAVVREDLPPERGLVASRLALTSANWGGRQDIDLVKLLQHHRATFEQLARVLSDWRKQRIDRSRRERAGGCDGDIDHDTDLMEQRCALQAADRTAQEAQREEGSSSSAAAPSPAAEGPGQKELRRVVVAFNESPQQRADFVRAIDGLNRTLHEYCVPPESVENTKLILRQLKDLLREEPPDAVVGSDSDASAP